jgi:hypothetical protein
MRDYDGQMILRPEQPVTNNIPTDEPELQWLETGVNYLLGLTFEMLSKICILLLTAAFQLFAACREKRS